MEMNINLKKEDLKTLNIDGTRFTCDTMDLESNNVLDEFQRKYSLGVRFDNELMEDCQTVINTVLGDGSYDTLFKSDDNSLVPYYLCQNLLSIYQDAFMKDARDAQEKKAAEELRKVADVARSFDRFSKQLERAESKNYVANKKRPSNKNKGRR